MTPLAHVHGVPVEELVPGAVSLVAMTRAWLHARRAHRSQAGRRSGRS